MYGKNEKLNNIPMQDSLSCWQKTFKHERLFLSQLQTKGADSMAVFRVEKNQNYTVMSNHHLRNTGLSLKSKGLLSQMLSLPEEWDYTLKGLSKINREGIDADRKSVV